MNKIVVVSPSQNIFDVIVDKILEEKSLEKVAVVFPNKRPILFLKYYLAKRLGRAILLPEIYAFEDWIYRLYVNLKEDPERLLNPHDQAYIIYQCVGEIFSSENREIPSWDVFYPWGVKISELFKEFDMEMVVPENIIYPPDEQLSDRAKEVLERLKDIYILFNHKLKIAKYTTFSKVVRFLSEHDLNITDRVHLVGFFALSRSEDILFKKMFDIGAKIYWHADPYDLPSVYKKWKDRWEVQIEEVMGESDDSPEIFLFEAHDLISELKELKKRLEKTDLNDEPDNVAIVISSGDNIIPVLRFLPPVPVNITMGYPISQSQIFSFIRAILQMVLKSKGDKIPLKEIKNVLGFSYIKGADQLKEGLKGLFLSFVDREELFSLAGEDEKTTISLLYDDIFLKLKKATTLKELCVFLKEIFLLLKDSFSSLEKEIISLFFETIFFELENSIFSHISMKRRHLYTLFLNIISLSHLPFEGEPLTGLQILGLLETRLLKFKEVFLLDVNEGVIPRVEEVNPLIPYGKREVLGLPGREHQEMVVKYYFDRLIKSSKRVHIFWQYQVESSSENGFKGKKVPSRFVEAIIWEIEKREREFIENTKSADILKRSKIFLAPEGFSIPKSLKKDRSVEHILREKIKNLTPTLLQLYMECPVRFLYKEVLNLPVPIEDREIDFKAIGIAVHNALKKFYYNRSNKDKVPFEVRREELKVESLKGLFEKEIEKYEFYRFLSQKRKEILLMGAGHRFERFIYNHPDKTAVLFLEKEFSYLFSHELDVRIVGRIDRVDIRDGKYVIIDYKTGLFNKSKIKLEDLETLLLDHYTEESLKEFYNRIKDIQMLFYVLLLLQSSEKFIKQYATKINACYIDLRRDGKEYFVFKTPLAIEEKGIKAVLSNLIEFLIRHMLESSYWYPASDESICSWCNYKDICRYS